MWLLDMLTHLSHFDSPESMKINKNAIGCTSRALEASGDFDYGEDDYRY